MYSSSREFPFVRVLLLVGMITVSGCATRKFVRQEVAKIDTKVTAADTKSKENAERIDAVDKRAAKGIADTASANTKATQAATAASAADTKATNALRTADTANQRVAAVVTRITSVEYRFNTVDRYTAGPAQSVTFKLNSSVLSTAAKGTLDSIATQVTNLTSGYAIEIEGFTDSTGSAAYNNALSNRRATSVLRYLVSKNVALHRITIVGLGESNPAGDNKTKAGREQNRRVEVKVLRSPMGHTTS